MRLGILVQEVSDQIKYSLLSHNSATYRVLLYFKIVQETIEIHQSVQPLEVM